MIISGPSSPCNFAIEDDLEIISSGPSSTFKTRSRLDLPPCTDATNNGTKVPLNSTLTLSLDPKPVGQVIHRPPPVLSLFRGSQQTATMATGMGSVNSMGTNIGVPSPVRQAWGVSNSSSNSQCSNTKDQAGAVQEHQLNQTFTKMEGIEPLVASPVVHKQVTMSQCVSGPVSNSRQFTTVANSNKCTEKGVLMQYNECKTSYVNSSGPLSSVTNNNSKALNETFTQQEPSQTATTHQAGNARTYTINSAPFIKPPTSQVHSTSSVTQAPVAVRTNGQNSRVGVPSVGQSAVVSDNSVHTLKENNASSHSNVHIKAGATVTKSKPTVITAPHGGE